MATAAGKVNGKRKAEMTDDSDEMSEDIEISSDGGCGSDSDFDVEQEKETKKQSQKQSKSKSTDPKTLEEALKRIHELESENAQLRGQISEKQPAGKKQKTLGVTAGNNKEQDEKVVKGLKTSLAQQIKQVMQWKKSLKYGTSRLNIQLPNLTTSQVELLLGPEVMKSASKGPKQISVTVSTSDADELLDADLSTSLRYGGRLRLCKGLKLVFNKGEGTLRVTGNYGMPGSANRAFDGEADW